MIRMRTRTRHETMFVMSCFFNQHQLQECDAYYATGKVSDFDLQEQRLRGVCVKNIFNLCSSEYPPLSLVQFCLESHGYEHSTNVFVGKICSRYLAVQIINGTFLNQKTAAK
jgi:hypothetical protein